MYQLCAIWRDDSKEPIKGRVKAYEFVGAFFTCITESDANLALPADLLQSVELRELSAEEEAIPYHESNTFREGDKSPWFAGMGQGKK
jgi:hypothetical protein